MLAPEEGRPPVKEEAIELIADRVIAALRDDLEVIAVQLSARGTLAEQLTVGQVARRLGVARSTVYAHWREWGGYKLGRGDKAPIRFDSGALPVAADKPRSQQPLKTDRVSSPARRHRRRWDLLVDAPRFPQPVDGIR